MALFKYRAVCPVCGEKDPSNDGSKAGPNLRCSCCGAYCRYKESRLEWLPVAFIFAGCFGAIALWPKLDYLWFCMTFLFIPLIILPLRKYIGTNELFARGPICPACDYDLHGSTSDTCPECGHDVRRAREKAKKFESKKGE